MKKQANTLLAATLTAALALPGFGATTLAFADDDASATGGTASTASASGTTGGSATATGTSGATGVPDTAPASGSSSDSNDSSSTGQFSASGKTSGKNKHSSTKQKQTATQKRAAALKKQAKLIKRAKTVTYRSRTVSLKFPGKVSLAVKKASFTAPLRSAKSGAGVKQRFYLTRASANSSYMLVRSAATGQALQAKGGTVMQATTSKKSAQQWRLRYLKSKKRYVLQNRKTGTYLTLATARSGKAFSLTRANRPGGKYFTLAKRKAPAMLDKKLLQAQLNRATGATKLKMLNANYKLSKAHRKKLNYAFSALKRQAGGRIGFAAIDLQTGEGFAYNSDRVFDAASTVKATYLAGINRYYPNKAKRYRATMYRVIKWSDNSAYLSLRAAFGSGPMRKQLKAAGVKNVNAVKPWIKYAPRDLAKMWTANYAYFVSNKPNASYCRSLYRIPDVSAIRRHFDGKQGRKTWSKSGWISGPLTWNESGVVRTRGGHTYLVAIMTGVNYNNNANWTRMYRFLDAVEAADKDLRY